MDAKELVGSLNVVDVVIGLALVGLFVLGYAQGAVRRGVGVLTMSFSFFLAGQLNQWLGKFLAENWATQYPPSYSYMIGYLVLFLAGTIAFGIIVQTTYHKVAVFARFPVLDEVLGGLLGLVWGLLFLSFLTAILDTYFRVALVGNSNEIGLLRSLWEAISGSWFGTVLHTQVLPLLVAWTSFALPVQLTQVYR